MSWWPWDKTTEDMSNPAASSGRGMHKQLTPDYRPPNDTYRDGRNPSDYRPPNDTYRDRRDPSCGKCEHTVRGHKETMDQMEQHYKEKLNKERTALAQCKEEFKSFKSRMAVDLKNELKAGDCESMDSPVSTTQLQAMYEKLILIKWKKMKDHFKTNKGDRMLADELIRGMFEASRKDMDEKKKQLEEMFALHKHSTSPSPKDVVYNKLAAQNLQMAVYHSRKEEVVKVPFLKYQERVPTELASPFRFLAAECYWLGCLMALNNPPLQPDWESLIPGPDAWNIFPPAITYYYLTSNMKPEPME